MKDINKIFKINECLCMIVLLLSTYPCGFNFDLPRVSHTLTMIFALSFPLYYFGYLRY